MRPKSYITRGEFAVLLAMKTGYDGSEAEHSFTDWEKKGRKEDRSCALCGYSEKKDAENSAVAIVLISLGGALVLGGGGFAAFFFGVKKKSLADLVAIFRRKTK